VTGYLVDRYGPRLTALAGIIILTAGLLMFAQTHSLWMYYAASLVIAAGQSLGAMTPFAVAAMNWFVKKRGRAMGIMNSGNAFGYFAVPVMAVLVSALGWREALAVAAVTVFVLGCLLTLVMRDRPEPYGYWPDDEEPAGGGAAHLDARDQPTSAEETPGLTAREALRTSAFYLVALASGVNGATRVTWVALQVPHLQNVGFSIETAGVFVAVYGGAQVLLRLTAGWLSDVVGRQRMYVANFALGAAGYVIFAQLSADRLWLLPLYYVTFALGHAGNSVSQFTVVADLFGTKRFGTIRGLSSALAMPLGIAAPLVAGWSFDETGSYRLIFTVWGAAMVVAALAALMTRPPRPAPATKLAPSEA
jgi:MFS family permease